MKLNRSISTLCLAGMLAVCAQAGPILSLNPSGGALSGAPGTTVGWGFTLTNVSDFLVVTGVSFAPAPLSSFGTFTDYLSMGFVVLGPSPESSTLTETFNALTQSGLGAFHLSSTASGTVKGNLVLDYALFSVDPNNPNFNPDTDTLVPDATLSAAASVSATTATPEPASIGMVLLALLAVPVIRRQRAATLPLD